MRLQHRWGFRTAKNLLRNFLNQQCGYYSLKIGDLEDRLCGPIGDILIVKNKQGAVGQSFSNYRQLLQIHRLVLLLLRWKFITDYFPVHAKSILGKAAMCENGIFRNHSGDAFREVH